MGNGASTPEFSRKKSKKEHAFIKLGLRCVSCNAKDSCNNNKNKNTKHCNWPTTFKYRWMSIDEEYLHDNPQISTAARRELQEMKIGWFELRGRFCPVLNNAAAKTLDSYSKLADLAQRERPTAKTRVKELRGLMEELARANVKFELVMA